MSSKTGAGTYVTGNKVTLNGTMASGKTFRGWYKKNGTSYTKVSDNFKYIFEAGGNATYAADTDYSISYNLDGGTVATANPTSYNRGTNTFTLNNPTRYCYNFTGWTGTGLSSASTAVSVPRGSYGNRSYTANWTENPIIAGVRANGLSYVVVIVDVYKPDGTIRGSAAATPNKQTTINVMPGDKIYLHSNYETVWTDVSYKGTAIQSDNNGRFPVPSDVSSINIVGFCAYDSDVGRYIMSFSITMN